MKSDHTPQNPMAIRRGKASHQLRSSGPKGHRAQAVAHGTGRAAQLAAIAASGDEDNADCAATDLAREFPSPAP